MVNNNLYDNPALYDALLPAGPHVSYYVDLARRQGGDVLELACGTGQLTVPIARAGFRTSGLDISTAMLNRGRQRGADANVSIEYVSGDMRNFDLGREFALIFIARNSLLHLSSTEEILATLATVRRHLAPNGIFAFDIFNPDVRILARPKERRFPIMEAQTESFGVLSVEGTNNYDPATQVDHGTWYISAPGKPDAWVLPIVVRSIFPQELPLLLAVGGLRIKNRFGNLSQEPFSSSSRSQVCLCEAA